MNKNNLIDDDYDFEWYCGCCGENGLKVKEDVNGQCPNCGSKYRWDFDCNHEDAVYIPIFECYPDYHL